MYRSMHELCTYIVACVALTLCTDCLLGLDKGLMSMATWFYRKLFFYLFAHLFGLVIGGKGAREIIHLIFILEQKVLKLSLFMIQCANLVARSHFQSFKILFYNIFAYIILSLNYSP